MLHCMSLVVASLCAGLSFASAPSGPWDAFNYAPESRIVRPAAVFRLHGNVENASDLISSSASAMLNGSGSYVSLDFGKEVTRNPL